MTNDSNEEQEDENLDENEVYDIIGDIERPSWDDLDAACEYLEPNFLNFEEMCDDEIFTKHYNVLVNEVLCTYIQRGKTNFTPKELMEDCVGYLSERVLGWLHKNNFVDVSYDSDGIAYYILKDEVQDKMKSDKKLAQIVEFWEKLDED